MASHLPAIRRTQARLRKIRLRATRLREQVHLNRKRGRNTKAKLKHLRELRHEQMDTKSVGSFDGKPVPKWMIPWLEKSRAAGWKGVVVSGVRTPAHSVSLCMSMCGKPSCPGICAGVNSNHNASEPIEMCEGAIDVSDFLAFAVIQRQIGSPLKNALPNDRVHFSLLRRMTMPEPVPKAHTQGVSPKAPLAALAALLTPLVARLLADAFGVEVDSEALEGVLLAALAALGALAGAYFGRPGNVVTPQPVKVEVEP